MINNNRELIEYQLQAARTEVERAQSRLRGLLDALCPYHRPVQHRDGKPPWCKACGRDNLGHQHHPGTTPADEE